MTLLEKRLRRETAEMLSVDKYSRGRPIIVELEPGQHALPAQIAFRWKGTRRRYRAPIARLMQWAIEATVEAERREKKRQKKLLKGVAI